MGQTAYPTIRFKVSNDTKPVNYYAARELEKSGGCKVDSRSGLLLVEQEGQSEKYDMDLYLNYLNAIQFTLMRDMNNNTYALLRMGFIPIVCEPTFTGGIYTRHITPYLEKSGLPLYRRPPSAFCNNAPEMEGNDIWVHRLDCKKILGIGKQPDQITAKDILDALGVREIDS